MRKVIGFITFLIIIFIVNIIFYILSDDYKTFLKDLKNKNTEIDLQEKSFNDELGIDTLESDKTWNIELIETSKKNKELFVLKEWTWSIELKNEISLWKNYIDIINLFSQYNINKLEINSNLFDITDEYPDNYFEYYSKDLTLYLFPTKTYTETYDIFSVLSKELPFTLKKTDSFWDNSFFINLNTDIEDRFIRMIISNKWIIFWLKIKKTEYNLVKEKLNSLKN